VNFDIKLRIIKYCIKTHNIKIFRIIIVPGTYGFKAWRLAIIRNIDSGFENRVLREISVCKGEQEVIEEG